MLRIFSVLSFKTVEGVKGERGKNGLPFFTPLLLLVLLLSGVVSCSPKRLELPSYEGVDPREEMAKRGHIKSIQSTFSIEFERNGSSVRGDGVLKLTPDSLDLQVYSLGFLVAEVTANDTVTKSNPPIDTNRILMLNEGLRNSIFWWSIEDYEMVEEEETYRIWNSWRRLSINKRTLLPEQQTMELEDGREIVITYEEPENIGGTVLPSKMRIELSHSSVRLKIKTFSVIHP
jgi:hypothetical protein